MKVTLAQHGGLAATMNRVPQVLDAGALPKLAKEELTRLVAAVHAASTPEENVRARDAMTYTITVQDGGQPIVLTQSDTTMSPPFADLLAWLEQHFAAK
jgi:hypothetical protein